MFHQHPSSDIHGKNIQRRIRVLVPNLMDSELRAAADDNLVRCTLPCSKAFTLAIADSDSDVSRTPDHRMFFYRIVLSHFAEPCLQ